MKSLNDRIIWIFAWITSLTLCGCNSKSFGMFDESDAIHINRFDSVFFQWIESDDETSFQRLKGEYPQMLEVFGKTVLQTNDTNSPAFFTNLKNRYAEPAVQTLYKDAMTSYAQNSSVEKEFTFGFRQLKKLFPAMQIPVVYMHVSRLQQNMIIADSLLSCSIDKYMGADYPLYKDLFSDYRRKEMIPERMVKDGFSAWLLSEFPYQGKSNVLLDRMIYEGKIIYILTKIGNDYTYKEILSLTETEYKWLLNYESALWTTLIERKHLYTPDAATTSRYFQPIPSTFISEEAPGNLGKFIGYRIVERYMKQTKSTCENLMNNNNAQDILNKSKYKP